MFGTAGKGVPSSMPSAQAVSTCEDSRADHAHVKAAGHAFQPEILLQVTT
jgi:hypothetical protein